MEDFTFSIYKTQISAFSWKFILMEKVLCIVPKRYSYGILDVNIRY